MGDLLGNLVFVVVAILAWVVKEAMERKEAKDAQQKRRERSGAPGPATDVGTGEVDVAYGRRKIPDALTAPPPSNERAAAIAVTPKTAAAPRERSGGRLVSFEGHRMALEIQETAAAAAFTDARPVQGADAWLRLGLRTGTSRRDATRAGILWNEVLGPPRALTGPHRSPARKRMQART